LAAIEGAAWAGAAALGALALGVALARWRAGSFPAHPLRLALAAAALTSLGAAWGALRRVSLERCARLADRQLGGHDRLLSALAFLRARGRVPLTLFMSAAIAAAVGRGQACAPGAVAPFRRPRALPGLASAVSLVVL